MGKSGFTLLQMSLVFIIIGLIIGGTLTGRDLIDTAAQRAQIAQIDKYNTAVGTFQNKYGGLPGDLPDPQASQFGFQARGTSSGQGDGNGLIQGIGTAHGSSYCGYDEGTGETAMFWVDLSTAGLIDGTFNTASFVNAPAGTVTASSAPSIAAYFPSAKIGNGNYIYVWNGGYSSNYVFGGACRVGDATNYFGLSSIASITTSGSLFDNSTSLTVQQAYNIDKKIDDGLPQSGAVLAIYVNDNTPDSGEAAWAAGGGNFGAEMGSPTYAPTTAATPYASTNCYDNNNTAGVQQTYSLAKNANAQNCALSIQFQQ